MCGIIGVFGNVDSVGLVKSGLGVLQNRGRDNFGITTSKGVIFAKTPLSLKVSKSSNSMGHALHSIVSFVKQPLSRQGKLVYNGEIYNWDRLNKKHELNVDNDAELLLVLIEKIGLELTLKELDGVYAFAYWHDNKVFVARDVLGVKPVWYSAQSGLSFASEKKALEKNGFLDVVELNPREILVYDLDKKSISFFKRPFFTTTPLHKKSFDSIKKELSGLITHAVSKRVPDKKFGILFSGGVDSTLIALICQQLGLDFTCYNASLQYDSMKKPEDLVYSEMIAGKYGFKLKKIKIPLNKVESYLKKIVPLIEDTNVVKVGVALPFFVAAEQARKDGCKVLFSGLGSEEIFAGYQRHRNSLKLNEECLSGLRKMYERDLYRDDVVTMNNSIELRLPFLDNALVEYSLKIPPGLKLKDNIEKYILREVAVDLGLEEQFAFRKKRAAQYGSNFDKAISKLAKNQGLKFKSQYLKQFYPQHNLKLGVLFSSGKDSNLALHIMQKQNYEISCLITLKSQNPSSYMFHTPNIDLAELQARAMGIPLITQTTKGEKELELEDLEFALKKAKSKFGIQGVVTGALFSNYQRERIEKIADELALKIFSPLWHINQETEMHQLLSEGFKFLFSSVAAEGFSKDWLGKVITEEHLNKLVNLNKKYCINIAGEGGEFESLVIDAPFYKKSLKIEKSRIIMEDECTGSFIVDKAGLVDK